MSLGLSQRMRARDGTKIHILQAINELRIRLLPSFLLKVRIVRHRPWVVRVIIILFNTNLKNFNRVTLIDVSAGDSPNLTASL